VERSITDRARRGRGGTSKGFPKLGDGHEVRTVREAP